MNNSIEYSLNFVLVEVQGLSCYTFEIQGAAF